MPEFPPAGTSNDRPVETTWVSATEYFRFGTEHAAGT